jgi:hypothetical protein
MRAAHVFGAGVFSGGVVFGVASEDLEIWLWLLVAAGVALLVPILFASVVSSHAPASVRHRVLVFGGRVRAGGHDGRHGAR